MRSIAQRARTLAIAQLLVAAIVPAARAANDFWAAPVSDNFENNARWTDGSRPTAGDSATFNQPGPYEVRFNEATFAAYGGEPTINDLAISSGTVTLLTTAGPTRTLVVNGSGGTKDVKVDSGTLFVGSTLGALNVDAAGILWVENNGTLHVTNNSRLDAELLGLIRTGGHTST